MTYTDNTARAAAIESSNARVFTAYEKDAAFSRAAAYAILKDGQHVGSVQISFPRDGAGRLRAYKTDLVSSEYVVRTMGSATGCGYDKRSAAMAGPFLGVELVDAGWSWDHQLREAGFEVIQVL